MDPDEALATLLRVVERMRTQGGPRDIPDAYDSLEIMVDHFEALDEWLSTGGYPPAGWALPRS